MFAVSLTIYVKSSVACLIPLGSVHDYSLCKGMALQIEIVGGGELKRSDLQRGKLCRPDAKTDYLGQVACKEPRFGLLRVSRILTLV